MRVWLITVSFLVCNRHLSGVASGAEERALISYIEAKSLVS